MTMTVRRMLLLTAAGLLTVSALLAVGILLFGSFGETEGRILATTALLAAFAVAALPGAVLLDRRQLPLLAALVVGLAVVGGTLALSAVWTDDPPESLGKTIGTAVVFLLATAQTALLALRRTDADTRTVRTLFPVSIVLALAAASMFAFQLWTEHEAGPFLRLLGAVVVLDLLTAALQPILARARPLEQSYRLRVALADGEATEIKVEAPDLAEAAARAIRAAEREGRPAVGVELAGAEIRRPDEALLR